MPRVALSSLKLIVRCRTLERDLPFSSDLAKEGIHQSISKHRLIISHNQATTINPSEHTKKQKRWLLPCRSLLSSWRDGTRNNSEGGIIQGQMLKVTIQKRRQKGTDIYQVPLSGAGCLSPTFHSTIPPAPLLTPFYKLRH